MTVVSAAAPSEPEAGTEEGTAPAPAAGRAKSEPSVAISSLDALLEYFISAGEKGVTINRYKGLGEMNPDQLWATTMDPEARTLLQVRADIGARMNTLESTKSLHEQIDVTSAAVLSDLQDLDYAEAVSRLKFQTFVLEAAQQSYVKVQGLSLFNFLR